MRNELHGGGRDHVEIGKTIIENKDEGGIKKASGFCRNMERETIVYMNRKYFK